MKKRLFLVFTAFTIAFAVRAQENTLTFGLFADVQYADAPMRYDRHFRLSLNKLDSCICFFNNYPIEFAINLGDLVDRKNNDLDLVNRHLARLQAPLYNLTGNHDYQEVTNNEQLYQQLNMPASYYSFRKGNWVFVMLNTNEVASYANLKETPLEEELNRMKDAIKQAKGKQGQTWNGGISRKQLKWLNKILRKSERRGDCVLIFSHHPIASMADYIALNSDEILRTIGQYQCVKALFSGHHHPGAFDTYQGIPSITLPGMVETPNQNSFAIVQLTPESIEVKGYGRANSYTFSLK